jgi:predicted nucleotidyltransferase
VTLSELETTLRTVLATRSDLTFALLFGSSVTRGPDVAHDIDLAIATSSPWSLLELGELASALEHATGKPVDLVDIDAANTLLRWEVVRDGRPVLIRDLDALRELQARVPVEYADLRPYLDREASGLRRALGVR